MSKQQSPTSWTVGALDKQQRSILAYAESCAVDAGGLMEAIRMNAEDMSNLKQMQAAGLLDFGRVPAAMLGTGVKPWTHWVILSDTGWSLAAEVRRERANQRGPFARAAIAATAGSAS